MYIITSTSSSVSISLCHYLPNVCLCIPRRRNCRSVRNWNFSPQNHSLPRALNIVEGSKGCPNFIASPLPLSPPVLSFRLKQTNSFVKLNQFWIYQLWLFTTHTHTQLGVNTSECTRIAWRTALSCITFVLATWPSPAVVCSNLPRP